MAAPHIHMHMQHPCGPCGGVGYSRSKNICLCPARSPPASRTGLTGLAPLSHRQHRRHSRSRSPRSPSGLTFKARAAARGKSSVAPRKDPSDSEKQALLELQRRAQQGDVEARQLLGWDAAIESTLNGADGINFVEDTDRSASPSSHLANDSARRLGALRINKSDFTVNSLIDKISRNKLNLRPSYQREYVWGIRTASRLVESLLLNVPIPTIFFHETDSGVLEVVDGKQRLTSIHSFIQGSFPDGTPFKLSGLEVFDELNGCVFDDLHEIQQEIIKDYAINVHTITRECEPDFVFEVFERLNMGSTQLNEMELRNCIYQGAYTDLLDELSSTPSLLAIFKAKSPHLRMKDRELILRFFALCSTGPYGFFTPVKAWLNEEMRRNTNMSAEECETKRQTFIRTIDLCYQVFGESSFRPIKPTGEVEAGEINVSIWDTVMYSFSRITVMEDDKEREKMIQKVMSKRDQVIESYVDLLSSAAFRKMLVSQPKTVVARHEAWESALELVLSKP